MPTGKACLIDLMFVSLHCSGLTVSMSNCSKHWHNCSDKIFSKFWWQTYGRTSYNVYF